jgi:hypothetical protein
LKLRILHSACSESSHVARMTLLALKASVNFNCIMLFELLLSPRGVSDPSVQAHFGPTWNQHSKPPKTRRKNS